jgi:HK97 family phage major capsid protein
MSRSCEYCGRSFTPGRSDQRFCCDAHRSAWHRGRQHDGEGGLEEYRAKREAGQWPDPRASADCQFYAYLHGDSGVEMRVLTKAGNAGFIVPTDLADQIISARRLASVMDQLATVITTDTGDTMGVPVASTHGSAAWIGETSSYSASDDVFSQTGLATYKAAARLVATEELVADSGPDLEGYLATELGRRLAALEETAFWRGPGATQPLGLAATTSGFAVSTATSASTTSFSAVDIQSFYLALAPSYRATASWVFHPDVFGRLAGLTGSGGALVFPSLQGPEPTLYSRPVYVADFPAVSTATRVGAFGDFRNGYIVRRARTVGLKRLNERLSDQGQVVFQAFERVDGQPADLQAVRLLVTAAS